MQKRVSCLALCLALFLTLSAHAAAAERSSNVVVNGKALETAVAVETVDQNIYVSYWPVVQAAYPDASASWENGQSVARANGLTLSICPGKQYIVANGRYLHVPSGVRSSNGNMMVPARILAQVLGGQAWWDEATQSVCFQTGAAPIQPAESVYNSDDLYWLSRIIYAESGNQSMSGKIAVGNVILNRVADPRFPGTVKDVIFQSNQFTPVRNGSIYRNPSNESVIAAKLCLEGANTVGSSLYFVNPRVSPNSWASRNRPHVATIGAHAFFA